MKRSLLLCFACLSALCAPVRGLAFSAPAEMAAQFEAANKFYELGRYPQAIEKYQKALAGGYAAPALYYNLGNAYFKSGAFGQAVYFYRLAQQMDPRDAAARFNLAFVRRRIGQTPAPGSWPENLLRYFTANELTLISLGVIWAGVALGIAWQLRPDWRRKLSRWRWPAMAAGAAAVALIAAVAYFRCFQLQAVLVDKLTQVRYGPIPEAQVYFTLPSGAEVRVLDRRGQWLEIQDADHRAGWIHRIQALIIPPG